MSSSSSRGRIIGDPMSTTSSGLYRPPQASQSAAVYITQVSSSSTGTSSTASDGTPTFSSTSTPSITYVFDAVLLVDHEQRLEKTSHPVQTGGVISSHAYLMPGRVSLDIGMSDVMAAYSTGAGLGNNASSTGGVITPASTAAFSGNPYGGSGSGKSVSAYQTMLTLQAQRQPLTVVTRLRTYSNMVISSIAPQESSKTITGLRMRVDFEEIFTASTTIAPVSARPDSTQTTGLGTVSPSPVPAATQMQFSPNTASYSSAQVLSP